MSEIKLKSCPFCGGEAELQKGMCELYNYVMCLECRSKTKLYNTKESAIKKWNTRKPMQEIVERLEQVNLERVDVANMTMDIFVDGQVDGLEKAIELVKEVGGMNDTD